MFVLYPHKKTSVAKGLFLLAQSVVPVAGHRCPVLLGRSYLKHDAGNYCVGKEEWTTDLLGPDRQKLERFVIEHHLDMRVSSFATIPNKSTQETKRTSVPLPQGHLQLSAVSANGRRGLHMKVFLPHWRYCLLCLWFVGQRPPPSASCTTFSAVVGGSSPNIV